MNEKERAVMEQALEALEYENSWHEIFKVRPYASTVDAITALRTVLAQEQAEPEEEPVAWEDALKDAFFEGFTCVATHNDILLNSPEEAWENYKPPHTAPPQRKEAEPLNLSDPAVRKRLAAQWGYVPATPAEQMQKPVVGWMDPASGDVISDGQREVWKQDFGLAGQRKAALFTVPLRVCSTL